MPTAPASRGEMVVDGKERLYLLVVGVIALAFVLLAFFDLQSDLPYMDEYARQWSLNRLVKGQGLALWGQNPALIQILAAAPLAMLHAAPRFWRLPQLPFLALLPIYSWRLSRRFGADRFWSAVGAAAMVCSPLTLGVATGMMNDTVYLGLLAAGAYYMLIWLDEDRGHIPFILLAALATLQRLQGLGLVLALLLGLAIRLRDNRLATRDVAWAAAALIVTLATLKAPDLMRSLPTPCCPTPVQGAGPAFRAYEVIELPVMMGLFLLPLMVALWWRPADESEKSGRHELVPAAVGIGGLIGSLMLIFVIRAMLFPGIWVAAWGLGPGFLATIKPDFWPPAAFLTLEAAVVATFSVALLRRRRAWNPSTLGSERMLLILLGLAQFAPVLAYTALYDRFFLPVFVPLVPVAVSLVSNGSGVRTAQAWAIACLASLLAFYAVGEQDYVAWHDARDVAAQIAFKLEPPWQVDAGFEERAVHVWVPAIDDTTGAAPKTTVACPKLVLDWARFGDPRLGVDYHSLHGGRIVLRQTNCR